MNEWEIARYLIDAKKEVDSLWYIAANMYQINGDIRRLVELRRNTFYINAAVVVDKFIDARPYGTNKKLYKNNLQASNHLIEKLYMYRDKHAAHKDDDFQDTEFKSVMDIVRECITILKEVKNVCASILPNNITLNFVCYDGNLFRLIYGIDKDFECKIGKFKYTWPKLTTNKYIPKKIFQDTEDLWKVKDPSEYCVILKDGLTLEEGIQTRQDAAIRLNVLYGKDVWPKPDEKMYLANLMARKLGDMDILNCPTYIEKSTWKQREDNFLIETASQYLVYDLRISKQEIEDTIRRHRTIIDGTNNQQSV